MRTLQDLVTFNNYSSYHSLAGLILTNPPAYPLQHQTVVITGIHPSSSRKVLMAVVTGLGATVRDDSGNVRPGTMVLVCQGANPGWNEANRAGRKLQRAELIGARVFRLADLIQALRDLGRDVPRALLCEEQLMLFATAQHLGNETD